MDSELLWIIVIAIVTVIGVYLKRRNGTNPLSAFEAMLRRYQSHTNKAETKKLKADHKAALVKLKTEQEGRRTETAAKLSREATKQVSSSTTSED